MKRACTRRSPQFNSERIICFPKLVSISRQLKVISLSIKSTKRDTTMSISFWHLTMCYSLDLIKLKFLIIRTIIFRCSIISISEISWCNTVTNLFLFFLNSSKAFYSKLISFYFIEFCKHLSVIFILKLS